MLKQIKRWYFDTGAYTTSNGEPLAQSENWHVLTLLTRAVLSQGIRAMQRVFPTPNDSLIVICFTFRKVNAV